MSQEDKKPLGSCHSHLAQIDELKNLVIKNSNMDRTKPAQSESFEPFDDGDLGPGA